MHHMDSDMEKRARWRKLANVVQRKRQYAGCQLGPVMNAKLTEDRMDVVLDGLLRKV
jgi:hypothetical protein